jgi:hypothetical protein
MLSKLACRDRLNAFDRCVDILAGFATELNLVVNKRFCPGRQNSEFLTASVECKIFGEIVLGVALICHSESYCAGEIVEIK